MPVFVANPLDLKVVREARLWKMMVMVNRWSEMWLVNSDRRRWEIDGDGDRRRRRWRWSETATERDSTVREWWRRETRERVFVFVWDFEWIFFFIKSNI